jgi:hypothetical protein
MKHRRAGTAFHPARGKRQRACRNDLLPRWESGGAEHGGANSAAAIDNGLICVGPLETLPQMDNGLSVTRHKWIQSDTI